MTALTASPAWRALVAHQRDMAGAQLRDLFEDDAGRVDRFSLELDALFLDYSRHRATDQTMRLLRELAHQSGMAQWIDRMFAGEPINDSEQRPALHVALRSDAERFPAGDHDVMPAVRSERARVYAFAEALRAGRAAGATGKAIRNVVNLGVGGSDLGPRMLVGAFRAQSDPGLRVRFVANADPADLDGALAGLDPERTLFIIASKTFTTVETLSNARRARAWLAASLGDGPELGVHFAAVTASEGKAQAWGVPSQRVFTMWDWVGGRYSLWSSVGLPAVIAAGPEHFNALLSGARMMDEHFRNVPPERNMPVILALLSVWYSAFFGAQSHAVLPYMEDLREFPGWVQQLHMESNGKRVDRDGNEVDYPTAPVIWGATGTLSQHSFHQLLHQGTRLVPADFIVPATGRGDPAAQRLLVANALAQGSALLTGAAAAEPHRVLPGNRPSSTLLMSALEPRALGLLLALYEHKVFAEAVLLNLNPFDQWGVEFGKSVVHAIENGATATVQDASTRSLLARVERASRKA
jgi:glucose-6-phosphate isomerase